jgi:hypothetical protein
MLRAMVIVVAGLIMASRVTAGELEIFYAESVQLPSALGSGTTRQKMQPQVVQFAALGKTFGLLLEDNERLLRLLPPTTRTRLSGARLLRGTIENAPGSWVRLTLVDGRYEGALWDGFDLYALAPTARISPHMSMPMVGRDAGHAIYRVNDSRSEVDGHSCAVESGEQSQNGGIAYKQVFRELQALAHSAPSEILVSLIGDFEYTSAYGSGALVDMATRANLVDAIFSSQVGVSIVPTDFITYASNNDPFTTNNPSTLLDQFATFRSNNAAVRSRGLAHLMTGRELDGSVVGIARLNVLCQTSGVSITQVSWFVDAALVMAHELGHNFGAPHDGSGVCASTPQSYLMAPSVNASGTFSSCSLDQMRPRIAAATCITPARIRDVAIEFSADDVKATRDQAFDIATSVRSVGEAAAANVVVTLSLPYNVDALGASIDGGQCAIVAGAVQCSIAQLAPEESAQMNITLVGHGVGDHSVTVSASSTNDGNTTNDSDRLNLRIGSGIDVSVQVSPQPIELYVDQTGELEMLVQSAGVLGVSDVRLSAYSVGSKVIEATIDDGTCTVSGDDFSCQLGWLAAADTRRVRVRFTVDRVGDFDPWVNLNSTGSAPLYYTHRFTIQATPVRDIGVSVTPRSQRLTIGGTARTDVVIRSNGREAVENVRINVFPGTPLTSELELPSGISCIDTGQYWTCELGTLAAGTSQSFTIVSRATARADGYLSVRLVGPSSDDDWRNDGAEAYIHARFGSDVSLGGSSWSESYDGRPANLDAWITSIGTGAARNVVATISLPPGFVIDTANVESHACEISANVATCAPGSLEADATVRISIVYRASAPGNYTSTLSITADDDGDLQNNSASASFHVRADADATLSASPSATNPLFLGDSVDLQYSITTNRYVLTDASLVLDGFEGDEMQVLTPGVSCSVLMYRGLQCDLADLPANTTRSYAVRIQPRRAGDRRLHAALHSSIESNFRDNQVHTAITVYERGDMRLAVASSNYSVEAEQWLSIPVELAASSAYMVLPRIRFEVDSTRVSGMYLSGDRSCSLAPPAYECELYGLHPATTKHLTLSFQVHGAGPLALRAEVIAANDTTPENNHQTIDVTVTAPVPPPPVASPPTSGTRNTGGGGGGSFGMLLWAVSVLLAHARARRRKSQRVFDS